MQFTDIALLTDDVLRLATFYEEIFGISIQKDYIHTTFSAGGLTIALYARSSAEEDMKFQFSKQDGTGYMTVGFNVDDVDAEYKRLRNLGVDFVSPPTEWPWGAKSMHFRDPDGNIICFRTVKKSEV